jgi:hypothetical protein
LSGELIYFKKITVRETVVTMLRLLVSHVQEEHLLICRMIDVISNLLQLRVVIMDK